jgi:hypothetical protein
MAVHAIPARRDCGSRGGEGIYPSWETLATQSRQPAHAVWKSLRVAFACMRTDAQWEDPIRQEFIPSYFWTMHGVWNLCRPDLAAFHRCFYTIANRSVIPLDLVDHPAYDKWFPGRRRR